MSRTVIGRVRSSAALAIAAALGLGAPWSLLRVWWPQRHGAGNDPGSEFVARAERVGASLPLAPVAFVSDSSDPAERALHYFLVQHAIAPRKVEDLGPAARRARGCGPAIGWLRDPARASALASSLGMRVVAEAGEGLVLLEGCP